LPFTFQVSSTTPLVAMTNNMGGLGSCVQPGCGTDNVFVGWTVVRICPASGACENGDTFQVTTGAPSTVTPNSNVTQNSVQLVGIANSYVGGETVQIMRYGHAALTPLANMPNWKSMGIYASLAPAYRVDIGVPDTASGWQPPNGNCLYSVNHNSYPPPATACNKGDPDLFYAGNGPTAFKQSAYAWSGLPCSTSGQYSSSHGMANMDCAPLSRRDFTKAIVLLRQFRTGGTLPTAPEELITPSKPIDLSRFEQRCAPNCVYQVLEPDGSLDSPTSSITLRGNGVAILVKSSGGGVLQAPVLGHPTVQ
jgi:hypothetical protein